MSKPHPANDARVRALTINDRTVPVRLLGQVLNQVPPRDGTSFPTAAQVATVLHALADYTAVQHMLSDTVRVLGLGGAWPDADDRAHVVCRYYQAVADQLTDVDWRGTPDEQVAVADHDRVVRWRAGGTP